MLEPIIDAIVTPPEGTEGGPTLARNAAMLTVVLFVTPLCTLRNLTALQNVGAASMLSVLTVALCVAFRSIECQMKPVDQETNENNSDNATNQSLRAFPLSSKELLDAAPLFISSFVCHFNVLPIHNELRCPTSDRVKRWVRTSIWPATLFYWLIGFTGSLYSKCTPSGRVSGNILLDFDEDDPLLLLGRLCLAVTITLALPMLVIPARDIAVRSVLSTRIGGRLMWSLSSTEHRPQLHEHPSDILMNASADLTTVEFEPMEISQQNGDLDEPLLLLENRSLASVPDVGDPDLIEEMPLSSNSNRDGVFLARQRMMQRTSDGTYSKTARRIGAILIFWSAAFIACSVKSIDVVWDLLGSSFSIMMAFLIPSGAFLKLARMKRFNQLNDGGMGFRSWMISRAVAWLMILFFTPLMFVSTVNAVYNNFLTDSS
jgi:amino acid permease